MINRFEGYYKFLSNFHPARVKYEGIVYPSVEHAYQAQKSLDEEVRQKFANMKSAAKAKSEGRRVKLRSDWYSVSLHIMYQLVYLKFDNNPQLKVDLLATGNQELVEGNDWGDTFWGQVKGEGLNHLGKILMRVRKELREEEQNGNAGREAMEDGRRRVGS